MEPDNTEVDRMLAYSWPLLGLFWTFLEFAVVFLFVFFILWCFVDNFRRRDHHGAAKAVWTVVILFIPVIGSIVYIAVRPSDAQLTA